MNFVSIVLVAVAVYAAPALSAEDSLHTNLSPDSAGAATSHADSARTSGVVPPQPGGVDSNATHGDSIAVRTSADTLPSSLATDSVAISSRSGSIAGQIKDGVTQSILPGVTIAVLGSPPGTKSDNNGHFHLKCNVDSCTLLVSLPGYASDSVPVKLTGRDTILPTITLWNTANNLGKSVVVGKMGGQVGAYNKEKNSDNLKNVLDAELMEKLPDQSTADALQRVPGISIERDQGEGRYVQIRGTESRLSTVTINGQSIASPDAQTRAVALNVVPADQLAEIEVSKVLTPDMDGDAIGGTVNLVTSGAVDTNWNAKVNLTPGYTQLSNTMLYQGSGNVGKRFLPGGKLGIFAGGSYYRDQKETQGVELDWDTSTYLVTGEQGGYLNTMQYRDYLKTNERIGVNGRAEYQYLPSSNVFLVGSFNKYDLHEERRTLGFDIEDQDARPMDDKDVVGEVPTTRSIKDRYKTQTISSATLGATAKLAEISIDGNVSYSYATTSEPNEMTVSFERQSGLSYIFNHSNADRPTFEPIEIFPYQADSSVIYDSSFNSMKKFGLGSAKMENTNADEQSISGQFDVSVPFDLDFGQLTLKAGIKALNHTKDQTLSETTYKDTGTYHTSNLDAFLGSYSNDDFYNNLYQMNNMPDPSILRAYLTTPHVLSPNNEFKGNTANPLSVDPETFSARDRNGAGYLMGTLKAGQWAIKGGIRFEYTSMYYAGYADSVNTQNNWSKTTPLTMYKNFFFPLPDLIAKFSPENNLNIRASYTRSFSRPNWLDLVPHVVYNVDDNVHTATAGNPDLKPTTSDNIDLSGEYLFNNSKSKAYAGAFYKRMHDYIFSAELDTFINSSKTYWTYFTKGNGDLANLVGVELELNSQFFFLPSFLSGFGLSGNYIYTYSDTRLPGTSENSPLPGQSAHVGNAALYYEKYGFAARVALNYQSHCITELANIKTITENIYNKNVYVDDHLQLDCSVSQKFTKHITALIEVQNLTNAPKKLYLGDVKHTTQMEYYGWVAQAGVRLSL